MKRARLACAVLVVGCGSHHASPPRGDSAADRATASSEPGAPAAADLAAIATAEDERRPLDPDRGWQISKDVIVRRRAMQAMARIAPPAGDALSDAALLQGLGDEDGEVVGWAAYGLGWSCKGKEEAHVRALAARIATLADSDASAPNPSRDTFPARGAITRAVGRCGGTLGQDVLVGLLRSSGSDEDAEQAAYALGSIAARRALSDEALGALLDRAERDVGHQPALAAAAAALYPIGRLERVPEAWVARVVEVGRTALAKGTQLRSFAIRALEKTGSGAAQEIGRAVASDELSLLERADAARALGRLGAPGREAAGNALSKVLQDHAILAPASLSGDAFNVVLALVEALGQEAPKSSDPALYALAGLPLPEKDTPIHLRVVTLRCAAAGPLARGAFDAAVLAKCDPDAESSPSQRARLAALLKRPIVAERRKAFRALATSPHLLVREAAIEAIAQHPELEESGRTLLVQALAAEAPGVVATAAQTIVQHPERVLTLAASERRAALDPRAPPPTSHPAMDLPTDVGSALSHALAHPWKEDAVETRTALLDAAVAVNLPDARSAATKACADPNITVREHGVRALRALGVPEAACPMPKGQPSHDAKGGGATAALHGATRVSFRVAGATLAIVFEPTLTPLAAQRFVSLARSGFYKGIVVHRVVPGYVVQFGDPGADGYGGSGELLRCETSPVPFGLNDVGVALAGRDTGSSQIFVTLGRYPHLDGEYARVGHAEGDWGMVTEGDVVESVSVEE